MARLIDAENYRNLFNEEFKKTMELIRKGETHLDTLAEGFTEADRVIRALPTIDPVTAAAEALGMSPDRLRELAQAEKEGRLVVLPCKVGDTVYRVGASICKWREIDHCDEYCDGWQYRDCWEGTRAVLEEKFSLCDLESIGKTVFLTREAAEAALEEMEAEHDR